MKPIRRFRFVVKRDPQGQIVAADAAIWEGQRVPCDEWILREDHEEYVKARVKEAVTKERRRQSRRSP